MKAIETKYKGYRFRSRLEARWAVFFDCMGEEWEYEKEGYDLDGVYYLPDFWLPRFQCFIEIKGIVPTTEETLKLEKLRDLADTPIAIFHGLPGEYRGRLYAWDISDSSGGSSDWEILLCNDGYTGDLMFGIPNFNDRSLLTGWAMDEGWTNGEHFITGNYYPTVKIDICADNCKGARFEFGESGVI